MKKKYLIIILLIIIIGFAAWGPIVSNVEQAKYTVVQNYNAIEIRDYSPMIIAEVALSGEREIAIKKGFRSVADYIFGNNIASQQVAMTAPVTQQPNEEIAMTAPVIQQGDTTGGWKVSFVMPSHYTIAQLPTPNNKEVKLKEIPAKRYAVIRFSGIADSNRLESEQKKLEAFLTDNQLVPVAQPIFAFFNPPWTLPFFQRNEVMIEITP